MRKVVFQKVGKANWSVSNKGNPYIRLQFNPRMLQKITQNDLEDRVFLFKRDDTNDAEYIIMAPTTQEFAETVAPAIELQKTEKKESAKKLADILESTI